MIETVTPRDRDRGPMCTGGRDGGARAAHARLREACARGRPGAVRKVALAILAMAVLWLYEHVPVGCQAQLAPQLASGAAQRFGLGESLFGRLARLGVRTCFLDTQASS